MLLRRRIFISKATSGLSHVSIATRCFHGSRTSSAIQFYPHQSDSRNESKRKPVVVLFGWLFAKGKHLEKYAEMYQKHGADILTVHLEVPEILRPKKAEETAVKVLNKLTSTYVKEQPIVVHGFSVGGYLYSQVVNQVVNGNKFNSVKEQILGQIFDSPVDFQGIPHGISNAATKNPILHSVMKNSIESYLKLTAKYTSAVYMERSQLFYDMPITCPSMFLFSKSDNVSDWRRIDTVSNHWISDLNMDVTVKCWEKSPHVSHFYTHPDEYRTLVDSFFEKVYY